MVSRRRQRQLGAVAWVSAWIGLVFGQLHALARHNTAEGRGDLEFGLARLWSDPARAALRPVLNWASPDTVYLTYGKVWFPLVLAFTLLAFVVFGNRRPTGLEKWAWRISLLGYVWLAVGVFLEYWTQGTSYNWLFEIGFLTAIPGLLVTVLGSTLLGISLLRRGFRPKLAAWLLALEIPLAVAILQFTAIGNALLPIMFAFGVIGRDLRKRTSDTSSAASSLHASDG